MSNRQNSNRPEYRAAELAVLLARHYPEAPAHLVADVVRLMQVAAAWAVARGVRLCNVGESEAAEARSERRSEALRGEINRRLRSLRLLISTDCDDREHGAPCTVRLGGDPRGPCAWLDVPGQRGDGFGDGFAIY